jgi:hypothetical protein
MFEELKMIRSKIVVLASVVMLMFIAGCNREEAAEENIAPSPVAVKKKAKKAAPGASPAAGEKAAKKTATASASPGKAKSAAPAAAGTSNVKSALGKLNGYLPAAVKALQSDDVDTAKQYVKGFSDNWKQQSAAVKKLSPESFTTINAGVTQINNLMKADTPDKAKATAAMQSLSKAVSEFAKG